MFRSGVAVHAVGADELSATQPVWDELRDQPGVPAGVPAAAVVLDRVRSRQAASQVAVDAGERPTYRLVGAFLDGAVVGLVSLSVVDEGLFTLGLAALVDVVYVAERYRRRGIGKALLAEATAFAREVGAADIAVNVPPTQREVNRFYARSGFSPVLVRRAVSTSQLRKSLGIEGLVDTRDATSDLTHVQRLVRRRAVLARSSRSTR